MKLFNIARMFALMPMVTLAMQSSAEVVTVTACSQFNSANGQWADCKGPFDVKDLADLRAQVAKTLGGSVNPREIGVRAVGADGKFKTIHTGDSLAPVNHGRVQYAVLSAMRDAGTGGTSTPMPATPMRKAPPVPGAKVSSRTPFEVNSPVYGHYTFNAISLGELKAQIAAKIGAAAGDIIVKDPSLDMDVDDGHFKMFVTGGLYPLSFEMKGDAERRDKEKRDKESRERASREDAERRAKESRERASRERESREGYADGEAATDMPDEGKLNEAYTTLGLARNASTTEIKRVYRKLALKWHPDKNRNNQVAAEAMFKKVGGAFEIATADAEIHGR